MASSPRQETSVPVKPAPMPWQAYMLCVAVFLDLLSVALVIPLIAMRFKDVGCTPATLGIVGSVYSAAQIVGGIVMGYLSDSLLGRRGTLLVSMAGAGVAYYLVAVAETLPMLIVSRVIVGLVKQTMTASTAIMADLTKKGPDRVRGLSRLSASMRMAWIAGTALGGWLSTYGQRTPAFVSVGFYVLDIAFVLAVIPPTLGRPAKAVLGPDSVHPPDAEEVFRDHSDAQADVAGADDDDSPPSGADAAAAPSAKPTTFRSQLQAVVVAFRDKNVARVLCMAVAFGLVDKALRMSNDMYLQERFSLDAVNLSWMRTYAGIVLLVVQSLVVGRVVRLIGENRALEGAAWAAALACGIESLPIGWMTYAAVVVPIFTTATGVSMVTLSSLYTGVVPPRQRGTMLGALDVLNSAAGVVAPLVGGLALNMLGFAQQPVVAFAMHMALACFLSFICFRTADASKKIQ